MGEANICGERVREARERRKLDQIDLSVALEDYGISLTQTSISEIELQKRGVKDFEVVAIAKILKVTPHWLVGWKNK